MKSDSATNVKNNFSAYLDRVKRGESVLILEYGRPIAQLCKPALTQDSTLMALEREGFVSRPRKSTLKAREFLTSRVKLDKGVSLLSALLADREESN